MKKHKKISAIFLSIILLLSTMNLSVFAEGTTDVDPFEGMINIDSDWQGSVFGDNGGQANINKENFHINENDDGTVTLKSGNNRGKIASSSEGIAYYFKDVPVDGNFELTATAHVDSWTANNQVSFGLMLRGNILDNQNVGTFTGDYVAVGGLDQVIKGFYKYEGENIQKDGFVFDQNVPSQSEVYDLSIQKMGNTYVLKIGDETQILDDYTGEINYAGLFTSRNTTVTFSNVNLTIEGQIELGDWEFSAFGDNTRTSDRNPDPTVNADGSVTLVATGGKISSSVDGISFYHKEVPANANFEITTKAKVNSFNTGGISTPNQKSFGLMLRDEVGVHGDGSGHESDYVSVGALDQTMKAFYKQGGTQVKSDSFEGVSVPASNEEYDLSIRKSGNTYVLTTNGVSETVTLENLFNNEVFVGLYVARDAEVTFSNFEINVDTRTVNELQVDTSEMDTEFLLGQALDLTGLKVTAVFSDGSNQVLTATDYIVTGFNSSEIGTNTITINYNGVTAIVDLQIVALSVTALDVKFLPAKTFYYKGDIFDSQGFVVEANYENGYKITELSNDQYTFSINGENGEGYVFENAGEVEVTVISTETPETTTSFYVTVKDADLKELEIRQLPVKTLYFIGDELDLAGISVYANYDDNTSVRLMPEEYVVTGFNSEAPGENLLTITHKEITEDFIVNVKVKELTAIEVINYPKTTYFIDEELDFTELEISKVFDNEDREVLATSEYSVDSSAFINTVAETYPIVVTPNDTSITSIIFNVTVRENVEVEWKSMRFGQSTSDPRNYLNVKENGSVEIVALEGGGKITGDHDGITFYYTEIDATEDNFVLSADIKVIEYAKTPHDGQESFGIMARDAVNLVQDASVFASNIAAVGGFSGGTTRPNGTQLFIRTGVLASDGEGSEGIQSRMLDTTRPNVNNTHPVQEYNLTLSKTNSGFIGQLNDGKEAMFFEPDILNVQDDKIYVGFYTARLATIEVSNIEFTVTAAATDAPKVEPPLEPVAPKLEILSLDKTPLEEYDLMVRSNVDGVVTVKQGQEVIAQEVEVQAGKILDIPSILPTNNNTNFSLTFLPDDTQFLTAYNTIVRNFTVQTKTFVEGGDIYVSPTGTSTGDGTKENPLNLDTAIEFVKPGQNIIVLEGNYFRNSKVEIKKYNDGTPEAMKYLVADPKAATRPVIDFDKRSEGVVHSGNYWHVKGIDFARSAGNTKGYTIGGSHNIIENVRLYEHGDTGLQISRTDGSPNREDWPSYNLILNSISFDNIDPSQNNADGFAAKLTVGEGNVFDGNVSHNNIDDGWDLYTKVGTGAIGAVTIKNSIAFNNGTLTNGYEGNAGKNGFKLGGEGVHVPHVIENSIAFGNGYFGFTSNSNPGLIAKNNIGFNNVGANMSFTTYAHIPTDFTIDGFASYREDIPNANDNYPSHLDSDTNYMFKGGKSINSSGEVLSDEILNSLKTIFEYDEEERIVAVKRDDEGRIQWGDLWDVYETYMNPEEGTDDETPAPSVREEKVVVQPVIENGKATVAIEKIQELVVGGIFNINVTSLVDVVDVFVLRSEQVQALIEKKATIRLEKQGVRVEIPTSLFNGDEEVSIKVEEQAPESVTVPVGKQLRGGIYKFTILQGSEEVKEFGNFPVTLEFVVDTSKNYNSENVKVFYLNQEINEWIEKGGSYKDGVFSYSANHFSIYTVMEVVTEPTPEEDPTPGDGNNIEDDTNVGDDANTGDETNTAEEKSISKEKEEDEFKLPDTFSGIYNWLMVGFALLFAGIGLFVIRARKERNLI